MPTPRAISSSQSSAIPGSPWLAVTSSGSSVHDATSAWRRAGSASMSAEVVSDTGTPGHSPRIAPSTAAHGSAASVSAPCSS